MGGTSPGLAVFLLVGQVYEISRVNRDSRLRDKQRYLLTTPEGIESRRAEPRLGGCPLTLYTLIIEMGYGYSLACRHLMASDFE